MAWIESHTKTRRHHKLLRLAARLNTKPVYLIGHLHLFWWNVLELKEDGDITVWTPKEVAFYAEWEGNPNEFYNALLEEGWLKQLNGRILIHDWLDYAGRYLQGKYRTHRAEKLEEIKAKHQDGQTARSDNLPNLPNLPNQYICRFSFEKIWSKYPNKDGKKAAERHFKASVKTEKDWQDINQALQNYLASERVQKGYVKNGSTWFNNWRDWVDYKPKPKSWLDDFKKETK